MLTKVKVRVFVSYSNLLARLNTLALPSQLQIIIFNTYHTIITSTFITTYSTITA